MLNFTIPGTGSSGHLGGGLMLAILLGPEAAFLAMASVLAVQALFFADGGLLALGCNIFNLGVFPAFVAYPLVYRRIVRDEPTRAKVIVGSLLAAVLALQLGSLSVVTQTTASGVSELPFGGFALLMQPIHLAIGVIEGLVTAGVVLFVLKAQPDLITRVGRRRPLRGLDLKSVLVGLTLAAVVSGGVLAWFASSSPDGLEWSIEGVTGRAEIDGAEQGVHETASRIQEKTAVLPDYGFASGEQGAEESASWPAVDTGTTVSGVVGAALVLAVATAVGFALRARARSRRT
jgi:cobalt/nickel transport system permease protein